MSGKKKLGAKAAMLAISIIALLGAVLAFGANDSCQNRQYGSIRSDGFVTGSSFENCTDMFFNDEITKYPSFVDVAKFLPSNQSLALGLVLDPWNLNFGTVPAGDNYVTRFIDLSNLKDKPVKITMASYGNLSGRVQFGKNDFILGPGEKTTVEVRAYATNATVGNYTGQIDIFVKKPKVRFLYDMGVYDFGFIPFV
jgi:hypothetical protein